MKKSTLIELGCFALAALTGLTVFLVYSDKNALDEKTSWANVYVGSDNPNRELGKYHAYFINYKTWDAFRKERGTWNLKGKIYEIAEYNPTFKDYSSSKEIYLLYKSVVSKQLGYTYRGSGAEWLMDLCQLRLYQRQEYSVKFLNYDGTLLWETTSYLRTEVVYGGETPKKEGYIFTGWDQNFGNIYSDLTVRAVFKEKV